MATSAVLPLMQAIRTAAEDAFAASDLSVYLGLPVNDDPGDYLVVGVARPEDDGSMQTASAQQSWASVGARSRDEEGDIFCALSVFNGDADVEDGLVRRRATSTRSRTCAGANPSFGVAQVLWTGFGPSTDWDHQQYERGVAVNTFFSIHFRARICTAPPYSTRHRSVSGSSSRPTKEKHMARIKNVSGDDLIVPSLGDRLVLEGQIVEVPDEDAYSFTQTTNWEPTDKAGKDADKKGEADYLERLAGAEPVVDARTEDVPDSPADEAPDSTPEES
jgi:hypothetical protein